MTDTMNVETIWQGPSPIEFLEHPDPIVRLSFVQGLGQDGSPGSLPLLVKALHDPERAVRLTAAWALNEVMPGLVADEQAVESLAELIPA